MEGAKGKETKTLPETKTSEAGRGKEAAPKAKVFLPIKPQAMAQEKKASLGKTSNPSISQPASTKDTPSAKA